MNNLIANIPTPQQKRIVIIGGGFAGLKLARKLSGGSFQIVLMDKNNFHMFQPLFYQVATAGLEPSAISFPFRRLFHNQKNVHFRIAELQKVDAENKSIKTTIGELSYDYLMICTGADTNYFGIESISQNALPMKSTGEALTIRNTILENYEKALNTYDKLEAESLLNIVIVGGGPTGVELAGAIAEMKKYVLPKDYPELDFNIMKIYLCEAADRLLISMSDFSSKKSLKYLRDLDVIVKLNAAVKAFDGRQVALDNEQIPTQTLLWAAGVASKRIDGLPENIYGHANRIKVDRFNEVQGLKGIFAIGDVAYMEEDEYPKGHPQVAQVAMQQASLLAKNICRYEQNKQPIPFHYKDLGSLATIGRNRAVADLPVMHLKGFIAWLTWLFVHLRSILGVKNKVLIFINWAWNYLTYDQTLRLLLKPKPKPKDAVAPETAHN